MVAKENKAIIILCLSLLTFSQGFCQKKTNNLVTTQRIIYNLPKGTLQKITMVDGHYKNPTYLEFYDLNSDTTLIYVSYQTKSKFAPEFFAIKNSNRFIRLNGKYITIISPFDYSFPKKYVWSCRSVLDNFVNEKSHSIYKRIYILSDGTFIREEY